MNFEVPEDMQKEVTEALGNIKKIKDKYSDIATFGENKQKLI
jgi:succinate dehydrogenase/fumarate reductase-like Fe-S protein|tara:strand:+ start:1002 stop:1127 length:126 start_codon:yes stop_codon:yes gene_type:complete